MDDDPITDTDTEQSRAAALMRMTDDVVAPASLHAAVHAMTSQAAGGGRRARRPRWLLAPGAAVLAAVIVALVLVLGGGSGAPTIGQTARLALAPATGGAPVPSASDPTVLNVSQSGIAFPSSSVYAGWRVSGVRWDTLHGRHVTTVFYRSRSGTRIGYSIVSGAFLANPGYGTTSTANGVQYIVTTSGDTRTVSWWRDGHTCVISGRSVSAGTLLSLAQADERTA